MRWVGYGCILFFTATAAMGLGVLFQVDFLNPFGFSVPVAAVLGLLAASNINTIRAFMQKLVVENDGIEVRKLLGGERVIWTQVSGLYLLGEKKTWIPRWNYWSRVHLLEYKTPTGRSRTLNIYPDAANSDRLILLLRSKLQNGNSELRPTV